MCGENVIDKANELVAAGSPPRVRGKQSEFLRGAYGRRITPACAGKTESTAGNDVNASDHPRVCGENTAKLYKASGINGSPPRVRGKHHIKFLLLASNRITPACAGKTVARNARDLFRTDHPRVCGENCEASMKSASRSGSPPRVRGKLGGNSAQYKAERITPACAGKTAM